MVHRIGDEQESIGEFQDLRTQQQIRVERQAGAAERVSQVKAWAPASSKAAAAAAAQAGSGEGTSYYYDTR